MDLRVIETAKFADQGATMTILGLDGQVFKCDDGTPMTITVNGTDGDKLRSYARAKADSKMKKTRPNLPADDEAERIEFVVVATLGWHIQLDGAMHPFSSDNARVLYKNWPRIRAQVEAFMVEDANFGGASSTT